MAKKAKKVKKAAKKPAKKTAARKAKDPAPKKAAKKAADPAANMMARPRHGEFMWNELMTRDDERALNFFRSLLDWSYEDWPMGPDVSPYRVCKAGQKSVAGIMKMTEPMFPAQVPTHWCGYIAVRNVDESWARAASLGAAQVHPPTDIPQVGRFCIIQDPKGAVVALMTPVGGVA